MVAILRMGLLSAFLLLGCSGKPKENPWAKGVKYEIRCPYYLKTCYFKAQNKCQNNYKVLNQFFTNRTGGPYGRYKEFVLRIICI